jgi:hypothetical protein
MRLKELPMPDLGQIKQGKQGALEPARVVSHGRVEQSRRPAAQLPRAGAGRVAKAFKKWT